MKSRVMRKLFYGDLLIFLLLLLFQLGFQSFLFEPFLVSEQSKRLTQNMDALQSAIVKGDTTLAHQRIDDGMERGIVMVAEDQQYHQVFGQPIYQYQQCFTLNDQSGKSHTIVEDYLDSIPLQAMELGDEIAVNGYLVDDNQSLVMPSKVYRPKDGAVLGVDTFLIIDHPENAPETTSKTETPGEDNEAINTSAGIMISSDSPLTVTGNQPNSNDGMVVGTGVSISDVVFSPSLLAPKDSLIDRQYIRPVLAQSGPFMVLNPKTDWQAQVLQLLTRVFCSQEVDMPNQLQTLRLLLEMWDVLYKHIDASDFDENAQTESSSARLQIMMSYIHEHYSEPITLDDIASSVFISKNSALQLFHSGIQVSPVAFLIQYRLKHAAALLITTEKQVSAIAEETGFRSTGYFCRKFRELFALSPTEYRRLKRGG